MIQLKVNGVARSFDGDPEMPLLWYLRDILGLTGTKFGCGIALCGACTVHKNGEALRACITPMSSLAGAEIRTIEDISTMKTALAASSAFPCVHLIFQSSILPERESISAARTRWPGSGARRGQIGSKQRMAASALHRCV